ncbi:high choriolytic enzyme 1-like protein, partial [Leptotrombidium deliense]
LTFYQIDEISHSKSCVRFVRRSNQKDYIYITPDYANGYNCYSYDGRQEGKQLVTMQGDCVKESAMPHELIHAIGFGHENQ